MIQYPKSYQNLDPEQDRLHFSFEIVVCCSW